MSAQKVIDQLNAHGVNYKVIKHSDYGTVKSPYDFANLSGIPIERIAKSLLLTGSNRYIIAVLPVSQKVDLDVVAQLFAEDKVSVAPLEQLNEVTGYERHATTALGLSLPTIVDEALMKEPVVYVASGTIGEELEIKPSDLISLTQARTGKIVE